MIIGMDIGGTSIKLGAWQGGERQGWLGQQPVPQSSDPGQVGDILAGYISKLTESVDKQPEALGIGSCGLIAGGVIFQSPNTPWDRLPLVELLNDRLGYPCFLINDADAFLMAGLSTLVERRCIALGLTLGTGIGTALWIRNQLFAGGAGVSPEGGHITLGIDRARANTGIPGSWESLAGRDALMRHYGEAGGSGLSTPEQVAKEAHEHKQAACSAWARYGRYVGAGLGSLCSVLSPDYVLIGGGLSKAHGLFRPAMEAALERHLVRAMPRPEIKVLGHEDDFVALGGAIHARETLEKRAHRGE